MTFVARCDYCLKLSSPGSMMTPGFRDLPNTWNVVARADADRGEHWCGECDPREPVNKDDDPETT